MSAICDAFTRNGTKCTNVLMGEYCKAHNNSMKMIGPMRFRHNQERYAVVADLKGMKKELENTNYSDTTAVTKMNIAKAVLRGIVSRHSHERRMGPHTLADHDSYKRISGKIVRRKELRAGVRERNNMMHWLRGDGRDEDMGLRQQRWHYLRMVEMGHMTVGDAYDGFNIVWQRNRREMRQREAWDAEEEAARAIGAIDADNYLRDEPPRERTLAEIATDNQSVHTSEVVKKTKEMIALIMQKEVPEEYRWNMTRVSKTMSEIISECKLTPQAAWQFSSKYCAADTIYDMEEGIFGKLMDAVWQHVKVLDDPDSLKQIVKEELEMNIGMCAQGNLSRVANILVGILDGLNPEEESRLHKIGRAIADLRPTLTGKTQVEIRLAAMKVLVPFGMTAAEMKPWVEAVADSISE